MKYLPVSIIGVAGVAQSGKSTLGELIAERCGFQHHNFADLMRDFLYAMNPIIEEPVIYIDHETEEVETTVIRVRDIVDRIGWDGAKVEYPEVRQLMQRLGTEAGRNLFGENFWVDQFFSAHSIGNLIVTDVRFPNEAQAIKDRGGIIVRIKRDGYEPVNGHISETAYTDQDFILHNNGTPEELYENFTIGLEEYLKDYQ